MSSLYDILQKKYRGQDEGALRTACLSAAGTVGIVTNFALFAIKFVIGILAGSMAVMADAFNNLSDAMSSVISLVGAKIAGQPADREHPFGHGRAEYVSALIIAIIIIEVGLSFFRESVDKIRHPQDLAFTWLALWLLVLSVAVKILLSVFNTRLSKKIDAEVLRVTAKDSLFDAITTSVTVVSLLIEHFASVNIDGWAGLAVSVVVIFAGIGIARETLTPIIGQETDPELEKKIIEVIRAQDGVMDTHDLIIHNYGPTNSIASVHIEVLNSLSLEEAHDIADRAERAVNEKLGIMLVAHIDPVDPYDEKTQELKRQFRRIIEILDPRLQFHDFRAVYQADKTRIFFDLVIPYDYTKEKENTTVSQIEALAAEFIPDCVCQITLDRGFLEERTEEQKS